MPISPGVAVARAHCLDQASTRLLAGSRDVDVASLSAEVSRLDGACAAAAAELDATITRVAKQLGEDEAAIFHAHRLLLRDPSLLTKVKSAILKNHVDARTALQQTLHEYATLFSKIPDDYLKDRIADLRDVVNRISVHLVSPQGQQPLNASEPVVLVASELMPSQALALDKVQIAAILTEAGGTTGHAAILARSLGIPSVSGLRGILREVRNGDLVAVDGREGFVYVKPGPEAEAAYRKLQREYVDLRDRLIDNREHDSLTPDGVAVELLANVNGPSDASLAVQVGATGVGLYRTEYLFLTHPSVPDEEEQLAAYRAVFEAAPNQSVTIRTLDLGGDKQVPYLGSQAEANPFMGWRSIRLASAHPEFFQTQLRAILRAGLYGKASVLFPMISTLEEVQRLKRAVERAKITLHRQGVPHAEDVPIGIMLEVPAAAMCVDSMLEEVDFVSIGSNDLIQYVMAADRDNPKVAHLCDPFSPAVLRLLHQVIVTCNERHKPVTLCGEMAGRPRCFLPLFGMGLRRLSMSPAFVPTLKEMVCRTPLSAALEAADRVIQMRTVGEVRGYLTRKTRQLWPDVTMLDTSK